MITNDKWILDEAGNPVPEPDLLKWAKWFQEAGEKRQVAFDQIGGDPTNSVSTVFLGLDHSFGMGKRKLIYETMVFGCGDRDNDTFRYETKEQALAGHKLVLEDLLSLKIA